MLAMSGHHPMMLAGLLLSADLSISVPPIPVDSGFFEGRWAFAEETCDSPDSWTMLAGGNFISEDLTGTWEWTDDKLLLRLVDLATDEETGEQGGKFQMEGPVLIKSQDEFTLTIEPDSYKMKRC